MIREKVMIVYNLKVAMAMLKQGHHVVGMAHNRKDASKLVFYFLDTPETQADLKKVLKYIK